MTDDEAYAAWTPDPAGEVYAAWAPESARWSRWVKPVLFAHLRARLPPAAAAPAPPVDWAPPAAGDVALVLDLPREQGVLVGLALAAQGYRPVPLYNGAPEPNGAFLFAQIDVEPIMHALVRGVPALLAAGLRDEAPPAFLLDAGRAIPRMPGQLDLFDNRSVSLFTDFPSATFLLAHGVERALLVQQKRGDPQEDLWPALRRWQDAGVAIWSCTPEPGAVPSLLTVPRPSWYRQAWSRMLALAGLRRNAFGGFGGLGPGSAG